MARQQHQSNSLPPLSEEGRLALTIRGTTLMVYYLLLRNSAALGTRQVARHLGFSSPSLAQYHLQRLEDEGLIQKTADGKYYVAKPILFGPLKHFLQVGRVYIPRSILTGVVGTVIGLMGLFSLFLGLPLAPVILAISLGSLALAALAWKDFIFWRKSGILAKDDQEEE
ncbi:MAG: hypothetical protein ACFFB3_07215 [Candidatus Hodarchaeota archaeon]